MKLTTDWEKQIQNTQSKQLLLSTEHEITYVHLWTKFQQIFLSFFQPIDFVDDDMIMIRMRMATLRQHEEDKNSWRHQTDSRDNIYVLDKKSKSN